MILLQRAQATSSPSDRSPRHSGREAPSGASAALQADRLDAGRPQWGAAITTLAMFINHPITGIHPEVDLAGSMLDLGLAGFWILHVLCIDYQPVLRSADGLMSEAVSCLAGMDLHKLLGRAFDEFVQKANGLFLLWTVDMVLAVQ